MLPNFLSRTESLLSEMHLTHSMDSDIISNINHHEMCGYEGIPIIVIKIRTPEVIPIQCELYNKCLATACFPAF